MTKSIKVDKSEFKGAIRQQSQITLPINDRRNNPKFKRLNPHVKFEGATQKNNKVPNNPVARSNPNARLLNVDPHHVSPTSVAGEPPAGVAGQPVDDQSDEANSHEFLFHEIAHEDYSSELDHEIHGDFNNVSSRIFEGQNVSIDTDTVPVPTNLSVVEITIDDAQTQSGDGVPTYMAKLGFDSDGSYDDYEIRIVKVS